MGSSRRMVIPQRPPPNPNASGAGGSTASYNIPTVSPYDSGQGYQPFFMQQAVNPTMGQPKSFFNTYGSVGNDPAQVPYNATGGGISNNVTNFAKSSVLFGGGGLY